MSEFTIILEHMAIRKAKNSPDRLLPQTRSGDVIEADDIDHAWVLARKKYYAGQRESLIQINNIVPGSVEVDPEIPEPEIPEGARKLEQKDVFDESAAAASQPAQTDQIQDP
jgi:hypothetical protein